MNVVLAATRGTKATFPETKRQNTNPENMQSVECADWNERWWNASSTVIIPESDAPGAKSVNSANAKQGDTRGKSIVQSLSRSARGFLCFLCPGSACKGFVSLWYVT
jgi:hypothetical protein